MKVMGKDGTAEWRCDACDRRTKLDGVFRKFTVSALKKDRTGHVMWTAIAGQSNPKVPALLHCCQACGPKVKMAFEKGEPWALPAGPLRRFLEVQRSKDRLRALGLQ